MKLSSGIARIPEMLKLGRLMASEDAERLPDR